MHKRTLTSCAIVTDTISIQLLQRWLGWAQQAGVARDAAAAPDYPAAAAAVPCDTQPAYTAAMHPNTIPAATLLELQLMRIIALPLLPLQPLRCMMAPAALHSCCCTARPMFFLLLLLLL
jgi:hypothetical protein